MSPSPRTTWVPSFWRGALAVNDAAPGGVTYATG